MFGQEEKESQYKIQKYEPPVEWTYCLKVWQSLTRDDDSGSEKVKPVKESGYVVNSYETMCICYNRNSDIKEFAMEQCSTTTSDASNNWPEGTISAKLTMNPYLLAMAFERAMQSHMRLWEFINVAIWEKLGSPEWDTLLEFAANMELEEEDPKWKKRLKITARHEYELREALKKRG